MFYEDSLGKRRRDFSTACRTSYAVALADDTVSTRGHSKEGPTLSQCTVFYEDQADQTLIHAQQ